MDRYFNGLLIPESWGISAEDHLMVPYNFSARITRVVTMVTVSTARPRYNQAIPELKNITYIMWKELVARIHAFDAVGLADQEDTVNDRCCK